MIYKDITSNLRIGSRTLTRKIVGSYSNLQSIFWFLFYEMNVVCMQSLKEEHTQLCGLCAPLALFRVPSPEAEVTGISAISATEIIFTPSSLMWVGQLNYAIFVPRLLSKRLLTGVQSSNRSWVWPLWRPPLGAVVMVVASGLWLVIGLSAWEGRNWVSELIPPCFSLTEEGMVSIYSDV